MVMHEEVEALLFGGDTLSLLINIALARGPLDATQFYTVLGAR